MNGPDGFYERFELVMRSVAMPLMAIGNRISYLQRGHPVSLILAIVAVPLSVGMFLEARRAYLNPVNFPLPERPWYYSGERESRARDGVRYRNGGGE